MAGAYCQFCTHRCFVLRRLPSDARSFADATIHMATCKDGAANDRKHTGYDHTTAINPAAPEPRLYGGPDEERLHPDIAGAYESHIEPALDSLPSSEERRPYTIEEWTVCAPATHLPSAEDLVERLLEDASEGSGVDGYYDEVEHLAKDPEVLAAAAALVVAIANRITFQVADRKVAEHTVTWDDDDEPLVDGERLYTAREPECQVEGGCALVQPHAPDAHDRTASQTLTAACDYLR